MVWLILICVTFWPVVKGILAVAWWLEERTGCVTGCFTVVLVVYIVALLWIGHLIGGWAGVLVVTVLIILYYVGITRS